jgi:hypothetical protein
VAQKVFNTDIPADLQPQGKRLTVKELQARLATCLKLGTIKDSDYVVIFGAGPKAEKPFYIANIAAPSIAEFKEDLSNDPPQFIGFKAAK